MTNRGFASYSSSQIKEDSSRAYQNRLSSKISYDEDNYRKDYYPKNDYYGEDYYSTNRNDQERDRNRSQRSIFPNKQTSKASASHYSTSGYSMISPSMLDTRSTIVTQYSSPFNHNSVSRFEASSDKPSSVRNYSSISYQYQNEKEDDIQYSVQRERPSLKSRSSFERDAEGGLPNIGLSCYMNAILQCLFNIGEFMHFFEQGSHLRSYSKTKTNQISEIFNDIYLKRKADASPNELVDVLELLKSYVVDLNKTFEGMTQNDAHEFLRFLLDAMHNELRLPINTKNKEFNYDFKLGVPDNFKVWINQVKSRDDSHIYNIFGGVLLSVIECPACGYIAANFENFLDLCLPLKKNDSWYRRDDTVLLESCLEEFFKDERIEDFKCERCNRRGDVSRRTKIHTPPKILVLQIKRFEYEKSTGAREKIENRMKFKTRGYIIPADIYFEKDRAINYEINGVVNHYGSIFSGHYTAQCSDSFERRWNHYDDSKVYELNDKDVIQKYENIGSSVPYILFYRQVQQKQYNY